jgi:dolichol-phosphate mannosyltransferase
VKLSVVIPVFNEETNLEPLYTRLRQVTQELGGEWEFLFIDDGSEDGSYARLADLHRRDPRVKVLSLSRNFGQPAALTAGLDAAAGDAAILMDADLQHPPEVFGALLQKWRQGHDIVHTVRLPAGRLWNLKNLASSLFYRVFRRLTGVDLGLNAADFRLLDRKVVDALRCLRERTRFLRGITVWVGFRIGTVPYQAAPRHAGQTKYSWPHMARLALDGLVSFSAAPLYWTIYAGFILSALGLGEIAYALTIRLTTHRALPGWTSLIIWISLIGGLQLILMGVSGTYIAKIYEEVKQRPLYLIRERLGLPGDVPRHDSPAVSPSAPLLS